MKLIATVEIPKYIRKILISKSRRPTHYKRSDKKIPQKHLKDIEDKKLFWIFNAKAKDYLLCKSDGNPIIKNSRSAGTPKYMYIRGNDLHRLQLKDYQRSKIVKAIKEQMIPYVDKLEVIKDGDYPLRILMEIHTTSLDPESNTESWDVDNHGLWYAKVFPDVLSGCPYAVEAIKDGKGNVITKGYIAYMSKRVIENDNINFISQPPVPRFVKINDYESRKLVFKIYSENG